MARLARGYEAERLCDSQASASWGIAPLQDVPLAPDKRTKGHRHLATTRPTLAATCLPAPSVVYWVYTLHAYRGLFTDQDEFFATRGAKVRDLVHKAHTEGAKREEERQERERLRQEMQWKEAQRHGQGGGGGGGSRERAAAAPQT
jgi:hypothetical protein